MAALEMYVQGVSTRKVKGGQRGAVRSRVPGLLDRRDRQETRREPEGLFAPA